MIEGIAGLRPNGFCLASVTSDSFAPGTLVLLHSFRRYHPDHHGDLVLIHDGLDDAWADAFELLAGPIRWVEPTLQLQNRIDRLVEVRPGASGRRRNFYSLEAFRLDMYERVLFCDSDLLFRASIADLFARHEPLLAAGDGPSYQDGGRDRTTFEPLKPEQVDRLAGLRNPFNSGLLLIGAPLLSRQVYDALLDRLDPVAWRDLRMGHTDQWVLNHHFEGQQQLLPATYNYLLAHQRAIFRQTRLRFSDARVLHYNYQSKPWSAESLTHVARGEPAMQKAWRTWYDVYFDALEALQSHRITEAAQDADPATTQLSSPFQKQ